MCVEHGIMIARHNHTIINVEIITDRCLRSSSPSSAQSTRASHAFILCYVHLSRRSPRLFFCGVLTADSGGILSAGQRAMAAHATVALLLPLFEVFLVF